MNRVNKKNAGHILVMISLIFLSMSCIDQIDLNIPDGLENALVVQGKLINNDPVEIEVRINRLFNFQLISRNPINARQVLIRDAEGNELELRRRGDGLYREVIDREEAPIVISNGQLYAIELRMNDGAIIRSSAEPLLPVPKVDSISTQIITKLRANPLEEEAFVLDTFLQFALHTPLQASQLDQNALLRWRTERTYKLSERRLTEAEKAEGITRKVCYISQDMNILQPQSFDGSDLDVSYLKDFFLYDELLEFWFVEGYYCSVFQESLSEGAYTYFSQIEQSVLRTGNMFEPTPGPPTTNLSYVDNPDEPIYGYFYATNIDTIRKYIPPGLVVPQDTYCLREIFYDCPFTPVCYPDFCGDCLLEDGSSTTRPIWWKE